MASATNLISSSLLLVFSSHTDFFLSGRPQDTSASGLGASSLFLCGALLFPAFSLPERSRCLLAFTHNSKGLPWPLNLKFLPPPHAPVLYPIPGFIFPWTFNTISCIVLILLVFCLRYLNINPLTMRLLSELFITVCLMPKIILSFLPVCLPSFFSLMFICH